MFAPTAGFTESSMEVVIILTICAPVDSRLSRDFASIAVPTSLRVLDWASPIDNEGISIRFFLSAQLFIYSGSADAARTQFPILTIVISDIIGKSGCGDLSTICGCLFRI